MTHLIDSYEQQYGNVTSEITSKIGAISRLSSGDKKAQCFHVDKLFDESRELLEQMALEIHDLAIANRQKYATRLKSYKTELSKLEQDYRRAKICFRDETIMRDELFGGSELSRVSSEDQRQLLLDNTERLERSGKRLDQGYMLALESERVGQAILEDLGSQRESLQRSRERLRETNEDLGKSSRILTAMARRIVQNRIMLIGIVALMLLVIGATIYFVSRRTHTYISPASTADASATLHTTTKLKLRSTSMPPQVQNGAATG